MTTPKSCLYVGTVSHKRLAPVPHGLAYRVFTLFADVDALPELGRSLRLFSYNRFNLLSLSDRNHGPGDGTPIAVHARALFAGLGESAEPVSRIFMLCYPRLLGYVFNPLTVYYGFAADGRLAAMAYEVNNTLGNRISYVIPAPQPSPDMTLAQACDKEMWVSPFNSPRGRYGFRVNRPDREVVLAVTLRDADGPKLKALFRGTRRPLTDAGLARSVLAVPVLTFKVMAAIHWEALKLWLKGLKLVPRPAPPPPVIWAKTPGDV